LTKKVKSKILITGTAGFIGYHLVKRLVDEGNDIIGIDNINDYYDIKLKYSRLKETGIPRNEIIKDRKYTNVKQQLVTSSLYPHYRFAKLDLLDKERLNELVKKEKFDYVIHLAAQAGVRYSLINPKVYIDSNIIGFFNLLEAIKEQKLKHFIFASSSSVYGNNAKVPFSIKDLTDEPLSLYAATKKSNEVMAHAYSSLYNIPTTGLRFFTVYGPWGRPDMAYYSFSKYILENKTIILFNNGNMKRDFTYIDDIVHSIKLLLTGKPQAFNKGGSDNFQIFNIGNSKPINVKYFLSLLELYFNKKAKIINKPMQKGEALATFADNSELYKYIKYKPNIKIEKGLKLFCNWFKRYHHICE
jgi:UDP-glucuronate 4-epimerase